MDTYLLSCTVEELNILSTDDGLNDRNTYN